VLTGILYQDPEPPPTYESLVAQRQAELRPSAQPRERILDRFRVSATA
jgi:hypothetical protein